jgi:cbb3-type cytochrome oxidase cytochrome c subunit
MKSLEKFSSIFLFAGIIFFFFAFISLGVWPALMTDNKDALPLPTEVPEEFQVYYANINEYHEGLRAGRDIYIKEGCWHCHSQYVRPVGNEALFYGLVSTAGEYENELSKPQLFGTRRVGPDLTRLAGKHTNDWHFVHLYNPKWVVPESVMPSYTWYFDESTTPPTPKEGAIALVAYLQSLGAWVKDVRRSLYDLNEIVMPPAPSSEEDL